MGCSIEMTVEPKLPIDGYQPRHSEYPGSFEVNWSGMSWLLELMENANVIDRDCPDADHIPSGLSAQRMKAIWDLFCFDHSIEPLPTENELKMIDESQAREGRVLVIKFVSNQGFLVTPDECLVIAHGVERYASENESRSELDLEWSDVHFWASYNRVAANHGGYRIH